MEPSAPKTLLHTHANEWMRAALSAIETAISA